MVLMGPGMRNTRFVEACMRVCRVEGFDSKRMLAGAERCREKLLSYSTMEAYLEMLEEVYNFGRKQLVGLKAAAMMAMRERNAIGKTRKDRAAKKLESAA